MAGKIRIAHLITGLATGGAEMSLAKLVCGMDKSRFDNVVLNMGGGDSYLSRTIEAGGAEVVTVAMRPKRRAPFGLARLLAHLALNKPDILQTWLHHADLVGLYASRIIGVPLIWNLRCAELDPADHPGSLFTILRHLARNSSVPRAVIVNSTAGKMAHEAIGYHPARWEVIPNGFDIDIFKPDQAAYDALRDEIGVKQDCPVIGLVARYHMMKDHSTFIKAAGLLSARKPDVHFVMVGTGVDENNAGLTRAIADAGIGSKVHLLGEKENIPAITAGFDIATCSSYSEGFPNVVGEAMSCGVPCVVTDVGDCSEVVGDTGIVVNARDPGGMAQGWESILSMDPDRRKTMGQSARDRVAFLFSLDKVARKYESIYERIVGSR